VLERLERGEANCLVVAELRRLGRSAVELGGLLDRLGRAGVRLLVLDVGIDTGTEDGQLAAGALIRVGDWEPARIGNGRTASRVTGAAGRPPAG
jgi:DNA invertase Pin-like site-specific DNA recombinase